MQKVFDFISDPGHGWVKVPLKTLAALGIINYITRYSHMRGSFAYLEEDLDADLFHQAYEKCFGFPPKYRERNAGKKYSRVRGYDTYDITQRWEKMFPSST